RRHLGLALVWGAITLSLNALIIPLTIAGLEAVPVWQILSSRSLRIAWGGGIGLLSTLCICGCLLADALRDRSGLEANYETHLLDRIAQEQALRKKAEASLSALQADIERAASAAQAPLPTHAACPLCGYWSVDQRKVAGHVTQCRRRAARSNALKPQ